MKESIARLLVVGGLALLSACASTPKRLEYGELASRAMGKRMSYSVYTPQRWTPQERLPLVVFLHGAWDSPDSLDVEGVARALDRAKVPRAIILSPQGDTGYWEDWADGSHNYRSWVLQDLMPRVSAAYHTRSCPDHCHLLGISMGGMGAMSMALLEPGHFASVGVISAPILKGEDLSQVFSSFWMRLFIPVNEIWGVPTPATIARRDPYRRWRSAGDTAGARVFVAWGDRERDFIRGTSRRFAKHLEQHQIPHQEMEFQGAHDWRSWTPAIIRALRYQVSDSTPAAAPSERAPTHVSALRLEQP